jgi:hypothetical protein
VTPSGTAALAYHIRESVLDAPCHEHLCTCITDYRLRSVDIRAQEAISQPTSD